MHLSLSVLYPTMHHFVTCVHISVTKWCIVGYLSDTLWDLWDGSIPLLLLLLWLISSRTSEAMALTLQDENVLVFHKEGFQQLAATHCWEIIRNAPIFLCFQKWSSTYHGALVMKLLDLSLLGLSAQNSRNVEGNLMVFPHHECQMLPHGYLGHNMKQLNSCVFSYFAEMSSIAFYVIAQCWSSGDD